MDKPIQLKVGTAWSELVVIGEPMVIQTFKGYAPVLPEKVKATGLDYFMYISAKSIAEELEPLRQKNDGKFLGLEFSVRKASEDRFAVYEVKL